MLDDLTRPLRGGTWEGEDGYVQCSYSYELVINYLRKDHSIRLVEEVKEYVPTWRLIRFRRGSGFFCRVCVAALEGGGGDTPDRTTSELGFRLVEETND